MKEVLNMQDSRNRGGPISSKEDMETSPWRRFSRYLILVFTLAFIFWSFRYLNIPLSRFLRMFGPLGHKIDQLFLFPDVSYIQNVSMLKSIVETFQMGIFGTFLGLALCVPLAWFAALNMTPNKLIFHNISFLTNI